MPKIEIDGKIVIGGDVAKRLVKKGCILDMPAQTTAQSIEELNRLCESKKKTFSMDEDGIVINESLEVLVNKFREREEMKISECSPNRMLF